MKGFKIPHPLFVICVGAVLYYLYTRKSEAEAAPSSQPGLSIGELYGLEVTGRMQKTLPADSPPVQQSTKTFTNLPPSDETPPIVRTPFSYNTGFGKSLKGPIVG